MSMWMGGGLVIKSFIDIHMVSDSFSLIESQRNTGCETLPSGLGWESASR